MSDQEAYQFKSKLRSIFWPIHSTELAKFIPIASLMFFIIFNQNVLRILKDSILISEVSAEITSFSKLYVVTPMAAIFVIVYTKLINHLPIHKIFYYLAAIFVGFYTIFAFVIYPNIDTFHMDRELLHALMIEHPHFKWYIATVGNWSYVVFYALSELWPNVFYVLMFWQIANEITKTSEAKRFYTLFSLFGNSSLILVGFLMMNLSGDNSIINKLFTVSNNKIILTQVSISMVIISSILACLIVRYITKKLIQGPLELSANIATKSTRPKMDLVTSFKYIMRSKYLWLMLICSASFGLSMNLVEAVWKAKIKELYPTVSSYAAFNSLYILWTGITIIIMTIIGNNVMRRSSWFAAAVISPLIILVTGTMFFILVVFDDIIIEFFDGVILMSPLALAVFVGAVQNVLSKGSKYSILDTSTQMLYIPLDQELRTKGKAAVDVISPKIGKSASGLVQSMIFTILPMATYGSIASSLMVIFIIVCVMWIYAVKKVYFEYQKIV
ncbi:MAG: Npt1/Npt2 family nucleotide transporter [Rickettsiaceae bacterium]